MQFLCLGYYDERAWAAQPEEVRRDLMDRSYAYEQELRDEGRILDRRVLGSASQAATLRFKGGRAIFTDGPFAETKEQLGGLMVLEADDMEHAVRLMSQMPCLTAGGGVEIRPLVSVPEATLAVH